MMQVVDAEQERVARWLRLGGTIDSATTDHAMTWDVRGPGPGDGYAPACVPAVSMATRIETLARVFASWRKFLGPSTAFGFIESLGYWDIMGPDGTMYTNVSPEQLNNISGWIPKLDDVTARLLASANEVNPTPAVKLINHYQIDYGMDGVEQDTLRYGAVPPVGLNYRRILGAEAIMKRHGLESAVILNANAAGQRTFGHKPAGNCLVGCDSAFTPSHSAALRTLNVTRGYMMLPDRSSQVALFEQWMAFPNVTGPETEEDTGMWMVSKAAALVRP